MNIILLVLDEHFARFCEVRQQKSELFKKLLYFLNIFIQKQEVKDLIEVGYNQIFKLVQEIFEPFLMFFTAQQFDFLLQGGSSQFADLNEVVIFKGKEVP